MTLSRLSLKTKVAVCGLILLLGWVLWVPLASLYSQDLDSFETEVPFGFRMTFFKGPADSTRCLLTINVDNKNLLFYRGPNYFEAHYEAFLSMRDTKTHHILKGVWEKKVRVPNYDETSLDAAYDPLEWEANAPPGKFDGFIEIKDVQANTYGNGRVSVAVPDFSRNLPKLSTPMFYDPGKIVEGDTPPVPPQEDYLHQAALKYPAGKPIFFLIEAYADSAAPPKDWKLTAEVVKELMLFPRIDVKLEDGVCRQRKLIEVPTKTMGLGTYEVEVSLRDVNNNSMARASSFKFRIIKSADWIDTNVQDEIRYLKYLVSDREMKRLLSIPEKEQADALKVFWQKIDPVPATAINELRVQYFERIDYANKHFTTEQKEGWETNMGEVYILLGPPSEIYGSRLNQIWVYERENLVLYFFSHNLRNRDEFDEYIRTRRWWKDSGEAK